MTDLINYKTLSQVIKYTVAISIVLVSLDCIASNEPKGLGDIAQHITQSFRSLGKLIIATAYLAGLGFAVAGVFKFKQHRDNPTQIPLGTPLSLLGIGVVLVFMPSLFGPTGKTIFGKSDVAGGFKGQGAEKIFHNK